MRPLILSIFALFLGGCTPVQQRLAAHFRPSLSVIKSFPVGDPNLWVCLFPRVFSPLKGEKNFLGGGFIKKKKKKKFTPGKT
ncbi:YjbF family lipoprotein, partial [Escherichia coli]|nr:YjbF family lipoprotein [Escherichia coli]